ncbi:MAG: N-acetyl-gamma-glutamyl-phosphate reductase [Myxococcaceae bacterium]|nr:N-acetyl-gamma-glutamyl-phosphate reductase [Myxococcaceae bacterium]
MGRTPVGIIGASGYAGIEATRLLADHPQVELALLTSERWAGDTVARRLGWGSSVGALTYAPLEESVSLARRCAAVLLATPAEVSLELVPGLLAAGVKVVDLSGAFRLKDSGAYPGFYGFTHPATHLLKSAVYGIPELFREEVRGATLVANPGCYATAAALALAPLLKAGVLEAGSLVVDAASGTTGAGRKGSEEMSFTEVNEDFRAYRVLKHQHTPEIAQTLARMAGRAVPVTFTAHLLPLKRGILSTAYARLAPGATEGDLKAAYANVYAASPFVSLAPSPEAVGLKGVVGTNRCVVGVAADASGMDPGRVVVMSAIDNLVKGAAGQAVQNLNLVMGWEEALGLAHLKGFVP